MKKTHPCPLCNRPVRLLGRVWHAECTHRAAVQPLPAEKEDLLVIAVCCREWPVYTFLRIGRCGLCGVRPEIDPSRSLADYMAARRPS